MDTPGQAIVEGWLSSSQWFPMYYHHRKEFIIGALKEVLYMEVICSAPSIQNVLFQRFHCISWFNSNHDSLCVSVFQNVAESSECHSFMSFNTCYTDTGLW